MKNRELRQDIWNAVYLATGFGVGTQSWLMGFAGFATVAGLMLLANGILYLLERRKLES